MTIFLWDWPEDCDDRYLHILWSSSAHIRHLTSAELGRCARDQTQTSSMEASAWRPTPSPRSRWWGTTTTTTTTTTSSAATAAPRPTAPVWAAHVESESGTRPLSRPRGGCRRWWRPPWRWWSPWWRARGRGPGQPRTDSSLGAGARTDWGQTPATGRETSMITWDVMTSQETLKHNLWWNSATLKWAPKDTGPLMIVPPQT